jgi:hypothetical protein
MSKTPPPKFDGLKDYNKWRAELQNYLERLELHEAIERGTDFILLMIMLPIWMLQQMKRKE